MPCLRHLRKIACVFGVIGVVTGLLFLVFLWFHTSKTDMGDADLGLAKEITQWGTVGFGAISSIAAGVDGLLCKTLLERQGQAEKEARMERGRSTFFFTMFMLIGVGLIVFGGLGQFTQWGCCYVTGSILQTVGVGSMCLALLSVQARTENGLTFNPSKWDTYWISEPEQLVRSRSIAHADPEEIPTVVNDDIVPAAADDEYADGSEQQADAGGDVQKEELDTSGGAKKEAVVTEVDVQVAEGEGGDEHEDELSISRSSVHTEQPARSPSASRNDLLQVTATDEAQQQQPAAEDPTEKPDLASMLDKLGKESAAEAQADTVETATAAPDNVETAPEPAADVPSSPPTHGRSRRAVSDTTGIKNRKRNDDWMSGKQAATDGGADVPSSPPTHGRSRRAVSDTTGIKNIAEKRERSSVSEWTARTAKSKNKAVQDTVDFLVDQTANATPQADADGKATGGSTTAEKCSHKHKWEDNLLSSSLLDKYVCKCGDMSSTGTRRRLASMRRLMENINRA